MTAPNQRRQHVADLERRASEAESKLKRLYDAIENGVIDVTDPSLKDRIAELTATRDQAKGDAERAVAHIVKIGPAITPESLRAFSASLRKKLRHGDGTFARDQVRAVAQRVEVVSRNEVRIRGLRSELLRTLTIAARAAQRDQPPSAPTRLELPSDIIAGLSRLETLPTPRRLVDPSAWPVVVEDAARLAREGWATKALERGWSAEDLFGVGRRGSAEFEGLAVWLAGRTINIIAEWQARTTCGGLFYRDAFMRANSPPVFPILLWQFGR